MTDPDGIEGIAHELARVREERRRRAAQLEGEDPAAPDVGDQADAALQLEGLDDLARLDARIEELERQLAAPARRSGLADGTVVKLRFAEGDEVTYRVVVVTEEAADTADVLTADSPLGQALVGHQAGDTVTYEGPDGDLQAEVLELTTPG